MGCARSCLTLRRLEHAVDLWKCGEGAVALAKTQAQDTGTRFKDICEHQYILQPVPRDTVLYVTTVMCPALGTRVIAVFTDTATLAAVGAARRVLFVQPAFRRALVTKWGSVRWRQYLVQVVEKAQNIPHVLAMAMH